MLPCVKSYNTRKLRVSVLKYEETFRKVLEVILLPETCVWEAVGRDL